VNINETWCGHFPASIDDHISRAFDLPHRHDAPALDSDTASNQWSTTAICDLRMGDEQIEIRRQGGTSEQKGEN
jgi:hypothetical protein